MNIRKRFLRPVRRCKSGCSIVRVTPAGEENEAFKRILRTL